MERKCFVLSIRSKLPLIHNTCFMWYDYISKAMKFICFVENKNIWGPCVLFFVNRPYFENVCSPTQCVSLLSRRSLRSDLDFFGPVLDTEGKLACQPAKAIKVWTGNEVHISAWTGDWTWGSLVQSEGRYTTLTCFPFWKVDMITVVQISVFHLRMRHTCLYNTIWCV